MRRIVFIIAIVSCSVTAQDLVRPSFEDMLQQSKDLAQLYQQYDSDEAIRTDLDILRNIDAGFEPEELRLLESLYLFLENPYSCEPRYDISAAVGIIGDGSTDLSIMIEQNKAEVGFLVEKANENMLKPSPIDTTLAVNFEGLAFLPATESGSANLVVDALSKFLVDRVKQELIIEFYNIFRRELDKEYQLMAIEGSSEEEFVSVSLAQLFPQTAQLFNYQDIYIAPSNGKVWYTAYRQDLENMPKNFVQLLVENEELKNENFVRLLQLGQDLYPLFQDGLEVAEIDQIVVELLEFHPDIAQVSGLYQLYRYWMQEMQAASFDFSKYEALTGREKMYFSGLLFQQLIHLPIFEKVKENCEAAKIKNMIAAFKGFRNAYIGWQQEWESRANSEKEFTKLDQLKQVTLFAKTSLEQLVLLCSGDGCDQVAQVTEAVHQAGVVLEFTAGLPNNNLAENLLALIEINEVLGIFPPGSKFFKNLVFYSNFLIDLEEATSQKNPEQMDAVLQRYALPVGSYRMKRGASYSVDINAYPGLMASLETNAGTAVSAGVTAPIGIAFSTSDAKEGAKMYGGSSTLFLSVIDIGAPFAYRFTNDSSEGLPEDITWEQIFAPGVAYIYGIKNMPLSIMAGVQWAPELRKFNESSDQTTDIFRVNLGLTVDIPLFNIHISDSHDETKLYTSENASLRD